MLACVEKRFGEVKALRPVEWLSDNGSCYTARETITFAAAMGIVSKFTPARSPQSNDMAESLVKTFNRDYVFSMTDHTPKLPWSSFLAGLKTIMKMPHT